MNAVDQVLRFLGEVVIYGGGSAAVAYLVFQHLGKGWIDARFSERLEAFKHEQAKELQRLRVEIESLLSGALKLQEREFTVLPEAWAKLNDAYSATTWLTSPLQQYPDVAHMAADELDEFLSTSELLMTQRDRVRTADASDRARVYQDLIFWHRLRKAQGAASHLQEYVRAHGLFLPPPLKEHFSDMLPILWAALSSREIGHEVQDRRMHAEAWTKFDAEGGALYKAIEAAIESRLQSHARRERGE